MKYRPGNAQDIGAREEQQDAFAFSDVDDLAFVRHGGVLAVVADGMGGLADGGLASRAAVKAFLDAYCAKRPETPIDDALDEALRQASAAVSAVIAAGGDRAAGSTLAAAVLHDDGLHWISVGDSRVYLLRGGQIAQVTVDHTYANELDARVRRGDLSPDAAQSDPERDALVSYLGQSPLEAIDRSHAPMPLRPDDLAIVCSDGLYRAVPEPAIAALAGSARDPQQVCEALVAAAVAARLPHQDNCTVLAVSSRLISEQRTLAGARERGDATAGTAGDR